MNKHFIADIVIIFNFLYIIAVFIYYHKLLFLYKNIKNYVNIDFIIFKEN